MLAAHEERAAAGRTHILVTELGLRTPLSARKLLISEREEMSMCTRGKEAPKEREENKDRRRGACRIRGIAGTSRQLTSTMPSAIPVRRGWSSWVRPRPASLRPTNHRPAPAPAWTCSSLSHGSRSTRTGPRAARWELPIWRSRTPPFPTSLHATSRRVLDTEREREHKHVASCRRLCRSARNRWAGTGWGRARRSQLPTPATPLLLTCRAPSCYP